MKANEIELKRRVKRAEDLAAFEIDISPSDDQTYPAWVDEQARWMWDWGSFGGICNMIICYGLKDRKPDLESLAHDEEGALQVCDLHDAWTAYIIRFGNSEIKSFYAGRGRYDSEGWSFWENLKTAFREEWLHAKSLWGTFSRCSTSQKWTHTAMRQAGITYEYKKSNEG